MVSAGALDFDGSEEMMSQVHGSSISALRGNKRKLFSPRTFQGDGLYNLLLDLPSPVDQTILNEWLEVKDVSALDIAFCSHALRPPFLTLLKQRSLKPVQLETIQLPRLYYDYLSWLVKRDIQIKLIAADRGNWKEISNGLFSSLLQTVEILGVGCSVQDMQQNFPLRSLQQCDNLLALILISIDSFSRLKSRRQQQQYLTNLKKLKAFSVLNSKLRVNDLITILFNSPDLQGLMLNNCELDASDVRHSVFNLVTSGHHKSAAKLRTIVSKIKYLQLIKCDKMTDESVALLLQSCENLEYLKISKENAGLFTQLFHVAEDKPLLKSPLKTLDLEGMRSLVDRDLLVLLQGTASTLVEINLSVCQSITDESLVHIARHCLSLKSIMLSFTMASDVGIVELTKYSKHLETLQLYGCTRVSDTAMIALSHLGNTLHFLSCSECNLVTDRGLFMLLSKCKVLEKLCLSRQSPCFGITDVTLKQISVRCPMLKTLLIANIQKISSDALIMIAEQCRHLTWVDFTKCVSVDDDVIAAVAQNCTMLRTLEINFCAAITDAGLRSIARHSQELVDLNMHHCGTGISVDAVVNILLHCAKIQKVSVAGCFTSEQWQRSHYVIGKQFWKSDEVLFRRIKPAGVSGSHAS